MLEQRNIFIREIENAVISHKKRFNSILDKLGWTPQSVAGVVMEKHNAVDTDLKKHPTDSKHLETVQLVRDIPGTSKDSENEYNEFLASLSFQPKVKQEKISDKQMLANLLEVERNSKRRRISYRNRVHTKNKSHTEVLREVIHEQMEVLKQDEYEIEHGKANGCFEKKEEQDGMVEVRMRDGNPHLAWQTVGLIVEEQKGKQEKYNYNNKHEKGNEDYRQGRTSSNHHHSRSGEEYRGYHRHRSFSPKHKRISPSRHSKLPTKERSYKKNRHSPKRGSKHKRNDR